MKRILSIMMLAAALASCGKTQADNPETEISEQPPA